MYKLLSVLKRRSDMTREEFLQYWKEKHGPLARSIIPGLRRYAHNRPVEVPGVESDVDGIAELWFDDIEALYNYWAWRQSDAAKPLMEDEKKFSERDKVWIKLFCEELVMKEK